MTKARIEFLKSSFGNSVGDIVNVVHETKGEVYYYDEFRRYCYMNKSEEGTNYKYIPAGTRMKRNKNQVMPCGRRHSPNIWCGDCYEKTAVSE